MSDSIARAEPPILATKLFAPRLRDRVVRRQRLTSLLDEASGLVVVSAPAGFGKSTILADWLEAGEVPSAWLSLEPADNEPRRFLRYTARALGSLAPNLREALSPCLQAPQLPAADIVLLPLLNALSRLEGRHVLVFDDYHSIQSQQVHALMEHWIDHAPPQLCLVLATRVDPPFSLSRWRGQGRLMELRAQDLRFSRDESHLFLQEVMGLDLSPHLSRALQQRTEGWIVGLQMAALSLRGQQEVAPFVEAFTGSHRFVLDYLTDEVLANQPANVLDFLLLASLLERFCAPLCDALLGSDGSRLLLEKLDSENLFLIPLDGDREWFRFHHLFRQLLERQAALRIPAEEVLALRRRACDWLMEESLPDEAMAQALAAEDQERAISVLRRFAEPNLQVGNAATVMRWFDQVPLAWLEARPRLGLTRAIALFLAVRWSELETWAPHLQELLVSDLGEEVEGKALTLAACAAAVRGDRPGTVAAARRALTLLSPEDALLRGVAAITLGVSLLLLSEYDEARAAFAEAARWSRLGPDPLDLDSTCSYYEGRIALIRGQSREALERHQQAWARSCETGSPMPMASLSLVGQAEVYLEGSDFHRATELANQAITLNRGCFPFNEMRARIILVEVARGQRRVQIALERIQDLMELMQDAAGKPWEAIAPFFRLRLVALQTTLQGDRQAEAEWRRWATEFSPPDDGDLAAQLLPEEPQEAAITLWIRWLLWCGEEKRALSWARRLRTLATARQWHRVVIESWLLEGRAHKPAEGGPELSEALHQALQQAEAGGFLQALADDKEWIRTLPPEVLETALKMVTTGFRERNMTVLEPPPDAEDGAIQADRAARTDNAIQKDGGIQKDSAPEQHGASEAHGVQEALSPRELEVLAVVAAGGTNEAVGKVLFISPRTVKKHLENIYGKLGVHSRGEAVHRSRMLGLLPTDSPRSSSPA